ncbi:ABC-2 type transport system permease protein [Caldicellulosiruptor bescii]|uniref:Uncharacterized protein n=2 Tax=Caldicellulosiruptor bescii TaxID=31899 RepID=B9MRA8_CALBD|nr:ABC transporter permease [Caldicellulosiruptor bescii]ACM60212.1 hypothetical protein Athe_1111 [Caldicellulosiruptor bescii DSM 6725]PBC87627.1 ABC-2 type transport system permease protein [Caldicellulosiruptor bescii]PBC90560.1 ABC-2 type transport system permease protein [Caldicellulosiruptor bescii]PBD04008.1 ABC-2 type transport system permease protein [Caldicellulosiruptor bescii]PBD06357.1 ABC-2 type transport system permease protein [Caldicellulosiruptor bescii]
MKMVIRMSIAEIVKILRMRSFIVFLLLIVSTLVIQVNNVFRIDTKNLLLALMSITILYWLAYIACADYEYKTHKFLFTGKLSRSQIILYKMLSIFFLALIFNFIYFFIYTISSVIESESITIKISLKEILLSLSSFLIYFISVGSFSILVGTISLNFAITLLLSYICFNDFISNLISLLASKCKIDLIRNIMKYNPFGLAIKIFYTQKFSELEFLSLILYSIISLLITIVVINKKDLR